MRLRREGGFSWDLVFMGVSGWVGALGCFKAIYLTTESTEATEKAGKLVNGNCELKIGN
jgi:hypothetical protein